MKKLLLIAAIFGCSLNARAHADQDVMVLQADTVEILFGNNSKIIVVVDSKEDLEMIRQYDINAMLKDLHLKIEKNEGEKDVLVIEDKTGKRYLKDTSIVYEDPAAAEMEKEGEFEDAADDNEDYDDWWSDHKDDNKDKTFRSKRTTHRSVLDFGVNNYLQDGTFPDESNQPYTVKPFGSWYVALGSTFQTHIAGDFALEWGGNISWYNFKYQDPSQIIVEGANGVVWETATLPNPAKSKLTVTYINVSLVPVFDFGYSKKLKTGDDGTSSKYIHHDNNKFRIGFGGYIGYKIDSYSKFVYKDDGKHKDHNKDGYFLENFRYGLRFIMGADDLDFFVNYDLNSLFHENRGPKLNAFSFGISF